MKQKYYHGTSADNLESILKTGIQPIPFTQRLWSESYPNLVYLWSEKASEGMAYYNAMDSGSSALLKAKDRRIVIFEILMSDKYVEPDVSGVNMEEIGAVQIDKVSNANLTKYTISEDLSTLLPFLWRNQLANSCNRLQPPVFLNEVLSGLDTSEFFLSPLSEYSIEWEEVILKQSKLKAA